MFRLLGIGCLGAMLATAQESVPSAVAELSPAQQAAARGEAPYAALAEHELPLPPTAEEVQALAPEVFEAQATAMKRVLILQALQTQADGYLTTPGNRMASAALAAKLKAPEAFYRLMQAAIATDELSPRANRALDLGLQKLCELYRVDIMAICFYAESELASAERLADMLEILPLESLFNLVDVEGITPEFAQAAIPELRKVYDELTALYASIESMEQADAAVPTLRSLLMRYNAVAPSLLLAPEHVKQQCAPRYSMFIPAALPPLRAQRERLRNAGFYDCTELRVLDSFFE